MHELHNNAKFHPHEKFQSVWKKSKTVNFNYPLQKSYVHFIFKVFIFNHEVDWNFCDFFALCIYGKKQHYCAGYCISFNETHFNFLARICSYKKDCDNLQKFMKQPLIKNQDFKVYLGPRAQNKKKSQKSSEMNLTEAQGSSRSLKKL